MPILAQTVANQMRFALDAEGADYYDDDRDIIPAINAAVRWIEAVINASIGAKKFGEEIFREISVSRVFQTTADSRVTLAVFPDEPWTITGVYPLPTTGTTGAAVPPTPTAKNSILRTDLYHKSAIFTAKRLTIEEWTKNRPNPFQAGYDATTVCDDLREYAYLNPYDYNPLSSATINREIEIRPALNQQLVTVFYIKKPTAIAALTDNIQMPDSVFQLIFDKALFYISFKQGDNTTIATITQNDIQLLLQAIS